MPSCPSLRASLDTLHARRNEFDRVFREAVVSGDYTEVKALKAELEAGVRLLSRELNPFEDSLKFSEQYEKRWNILKKVGLIETLPSGKEGIIGIDGKEYEHPSADAIAEKMSGKEAFFERKASQGLHEMSIVPVGLPIEKLIEVARKVILAHYVDMPDPRDPKKRIPDPSKTRLWGKNADGTRVPLQLDPDEPIKDWGNHSQAENDGSLLYFPKAYDKKNHHGKTKRELLENRDGSQSFPGFLVSFAEEGEIPRDGRGEEPNGRKQIEANHSPEQYKRLLATGTYEEHPTTPPAENPYEGESGGTIEEWLIRLIVHLEEKDEVIDDFQGNGNANWNLENFFKTGVVSVTYWFRDFQRAYTDGYDPADVSGYDGFCPRVRV